MSTGYQQGKTLMEISHLVHDARARLRSSFIEDHRLAVFLPDADFPDLKGGRVLGLPIVLHDGEDIYVGLRAALVAVERRWVRA